MQENQAREAAEKFVALYYDRLDKHRHMVGKLYLDAATLTWNGNAVAGKDNVLKFLEDIPECAHSVDGYDAQPVAQSATDGRPTFLVSVTGSVKFRSEMIKCFFQTFLLTNVDEMWKIVSDCYRTHQ